MAKRHPVAFRRPRHALAMPCGREGENGWSENGGKCTEHSLRHKNLIGVRVTGCLAGEGWELNAGELHWEAERAGLACAGLCSQGAAGGKDNWQARASRA